MMNRREFVLLAPALAAAQTRDPIPEPHFPSRIHQFVWRNWELANTDRMARVLATTEANVLRTGASMGLPAKRPLRADQLRRLYITVIRQNWHLLPEEQLLELLGWTRERLVFTLKEDDFLDVKLGPKPACTPVVYREFTAQEKRAAAEVRQIVRRVMGRRMEERGEDVLQFVLDANVPDPPLAKERAVAEGEIDLDGWRIEAPGAIQALFGWKGGGPPMRFHKDAALGSSFRVEAAPGKVDIAGGDMAQLFEAARWIQDEMDRRGGPFLPLGITHRTTRWNPRYLYSYYSLYGDPLVEPEADPFPEAYLERLARAGINGVWMQAVLNTLAPSTVFPEFGQGWETRLANLRKMAQRAARHGVKIFLYLNEPRAMPEAFFAKYPGLRGSPFQGVYSMCTSAPGVLDWIRATIEHVFRQVPELGGVFSITMSENHTNCFSHGGAWGEKAPSAPECPRCSKRDGWETIADLLTAFRDGVRAAGSAGDVIAWDWGWGDALAERLIPLLPKDVKFMSISEWDTPVHRGGVQTKVGEYSISVTGPGPRAKKNWKRAQDAGVKTMAKVQFNNTWEISAVPYIPVPDLILEHAERLTQAGVSGIMAAWTCGGYPSPNLAAVKAFYSDPRPPRDEILRSVAAQRYGASCATRVVEAWRQLSEAFREFPYGVAIYVVPVQHGPANLLRPTPTGVRPSMILFPQDDVKAWAGAYPPQVAEAQFTRLAAKWKAGLETLRAALDKASRRRLVDVDLAIAETCHLHFQSVAHQMEFCRVRGGDGRRMKQIASAEIELARRQYELARRHSLLAFEATNHYYYRPLDLVEKILNCEWLMRQTY